MLFRIKKIHTFFNIFPFKEFSGIISVEKINIKIAKEIMRKILQPYLYVILYRLLLQHTLAL